MELSTSELVTLAVGLAALPLLVYVARGSSGHGTNRWAVCAFASILMAYTLTILEGVGGVAGEWLNVFEHLALAFAGIGFAIGAWVRYRAVSGSRGSSR